jgi:uncharacterized damage-inducible protein DinB
MDILERLLQHDIWMTQNLLERCRELTSAQLNQAFDIGHHTLLETWEHLIGNVEVWTDLMSALPLTKRSARPATLAELTARYGVAVARFGKLARRLAAENRLDDLWIDVLDNPPTQKTYGGAIVHVLTHNHSHRTEILHILERLGLTNLIEGDVLGWEQHARSIRG